MDSKMLSIRSFEKNQTLLGLINRIIIATKLKSLGIAQDENVESVDLAKEGIIDFLQTVLSLASANQQGAKVITGMDARDRTFVRNFIEAKKRPQKYRSILFKESPEKVIDLLKSKQTPGDSQLVEALTDLRNLIEEHMSLDVKGLVGDF